MTSAGRIEASGCLIIGFRVDTRLRLRPNGDRQRGGGLLKREAWRPMWSPGSFCCSVSNEVDWQRSFFFFSFLSVVAVVWDVGGRERGEALLET